MSAPQEAARAARLVHEVRVRIRLRLLSCPKGGGHEPVSGRDILTGEVQQYRCLKCDRSWSPTEVTP